VPENWIRLLVLMVFTQVLTFSCILAQIPTKPVREPSYASTLKIRGGSSEELVVLCNQMALTFLLHARYYFYIDNIA